MLPLGRNFAVHSTDEDGIFGAQPSWLDNGPFTWASQLYKDGDQGQVSAVQLASGDLLALIRPDFQGSPWVWETRSRAASGGDVVFGPMARGRFHMKASAHAMVTTASGVTLIGGRFPQMSVQATWDNGVHWQLFSIDAAFAAYGAMVEISADVILYVYGGLICCPSYGTAKGCPNTTAPQCTQQLRWQRLSVEHSPRRLRPIDQDVWKIPSNDCKTDDDALPTRARTKWPVLWNVDWPTACNGTAHNDHNQTRPDINLADYDICANAGQAKNGAEVFTIGHLHGDDPPNPEKGDSGSIGLWPSRYGPSFNGGMPQNASLSKHLTKLAIDLRKLLPAGFSGAAAFNKEDWQPLWSMNTKHSFAYRTSIGSHPSWNQSAVDAEAGRQFETAARKFYESTGWFPSIYLNKEQNATSFTVDEALRQRKKLGTTAKILPFTSLCSESCPLLTTPELLDAEFAGPRRAGADGIVVWGGFWTARPAATCAAYADVFRSTVGPTLKRVAGLPLTTESGHLGTASTALKADDADNPTPPPTPAINSSSRIEWKAEGPDSSMRSVADKLNEHRPVMDYGASGACFCIGKDKIDHCCGVDDTPAFERVFAAHRSWKKTEKNPPGWMSTVFVPAGSYRIDGTIRLRGQELILAKGAHLQRIVNSSNTAPVVHLTGTASRLTGSGTISSAVSAPRGVECIGPEI